MSFSKRSLIHQLEYDGFSKGDAEYGVENCNADWNEQAAKAAKGYIYSMSFTKSDLIHQLKYNGFTESEAEYGAKSVG